MFRNPFVHKLCWILLLGVILGLLIHPWFGPDIWNHVHLGQLIGKTGLANPVDRVILTPAPFAINPIWLFQWIVYGIFSLGGAGAVTIAIMLLWLGAFAGWFFLVRPDKRPMIGIPLATIAVLVCAVRFEERPEAVSMLWFVAIVGILMRRETPSPVDCLLLFLGEATWVNLHSYSPLAVALVGARWICQGRKGFSRWLAALGAVTAGSLVSPYGWQNWVSTLRLWKSVPFLSASIQELASPSGEVMAFTAVKIFWIFWGATLWAVLRLIWDCTHRKSMGAQERFAILLGAVGIYLSQTNVRSFSFLFLFSTPLWALLFRTVEGPLETRLAAWEKRIVLASSGGLVLLLFSVVSNDFYYAQNSLKRFALGVSADNYPLHFLDYARRTKLAGTFFNQPADGGFLAYHLPLVRPYGDSRFCMEIPVEEYFNSWKDENVFYRLYSRHDFNGALIDVRYSPVFVTLLANPYWKLVYADLWRALFVPVSKVKKETEIQIRLGRGEDLGEVQRAEFAIAWIRGLIQTDRTDLLAQALKEFGQSPVVPASLVELALAYTIPRADESLLALILPLAMRMSREPDVVYRVEELLNKVPEPIRKKHFAALAP